MKYTTEQARQLAREVGSFSFEWGEPLRFFTYEQLTALCNRVRYDTLLETAEWFKERQGYERLLNIDTAKELRRMAEEDIK